MQFSKQYFARESCVRGSEVLFRQYLFSWRGIWRAKSMEHIKAVPSYQVLENILLKSRSRAVALIKEHFSHHWEEKLFQIIVLFSSVPKRNVFLLEAAVALTDRHVYSVRRLNTKSKTFLACHDPLSSFFSDCSPLHQQPNSIYKPSR